MTILQMYSWLLVLVLPSLYLKTNGSALSVPVLTGPDTAYLGSKATFQCSATGSAAPVTYRLVKAARVIATARPQADHPAEFTLRVNEAAKEGSYFCMASVGRDTTVSNNITLHLIRTRITSEPHPAVLYEGSRLVLSCDVTAGSQLSYTWFFNRNEVTSATSPPLWPAGGKLAVERVTPRHAGAYSCMTQARVQGTRSSSSREVQVTVKVYLSQPRIAFRISKEAEGYGGSVTCWTSRGSPPAAFFLLMDGKEVASINATSINATESMLATFPVVNVPAWDKGTAQCRVKTEVQELQSETLTLAVVPVGGHVKVEVEYLYGADSKMAAAQLQCLVSRGSFPFFSWLLNDSVLPVAVPPWPHSQSGLPGYSLVDGGRILFLTQMDPGESGSYRCRVRDIFDDSSPWFESPAVQVRLIEGPLMTVEIISISFCCFLLLILVAGSVCVMTRMGDFHWANNISRATTTNSDSLQPAIPSLTAQRATSINSDVHHQPLEVPVQQDATKPRPTTLETLASA